MISQGSRNIELEFFFPEFSFNLWKWGQNECLIYYALYWYTEFQIKPLFGVTFPWVIFSVPTKSMGNSINLVEPLAIFICQAHCKLATHCYLSTKLLKIVQWLVSVQIPISTTITYRQGIAQKSTFALFCE